MRLTLLRPISFLGRFWWPALLLLGAGCEDEAPAPPAACVAEPASGCPGAVPLASISASAGVGSMVCEAGRCLETCQGGGGCASGQICTALAGSEGFVGVCVTDCSDGEKCPDEMPCQILAIAGPSACLPPEHGVGSPCVAAPDGSDVCGVAGMNARCFAEECHRGCPWATNPAVGNAPCAAGAQCALLAADGALAACLDGCVGKACPEGSVCEPDALGAPVCVPEPWSCAHLDDNPRSCGACRLACGRLGTCTQGYCGTEGDPLVPELSAPAPIARALHAAARLGGEVYVAGGYDALGAPLAQVDIYDVAADAWRPGPPLPEARTGFALLAGGDGRIYSVGGFGEVGGPSASVWVLSGETWSAAPALGTARHRFQSAVDAMGRLYVFGGLDAQDTTLRSVERLSPGASAWETLPDLPTPRAQGAASRGPDDRLYVMAGQSTDGQGIDSLDIFDPQTDTWSAGPRSGEVGGAADVAIQPTAALGGDGVIYRLGGYYYNGPGAVPSLTAASSSSFFAALGRWAPRGGARLLTGEPLQKALLWGSAAVALEDGRVALFGGNTDPEGGVQTRAETRIMGPMVHFDTSGGAEIRVRVTPSRPGGVFAYLDDLHAAPIATPFSGNDFVVVRPSDGVTHTLIIIEASSRFKVRHRLP